MKTPLINALFPPAMPSSAHDPETTLDVVGEIYEVVTMDPTGDRSFVPPPYCGPRTTS